MIICCVPTRSAILVEIRHLYKRRQTLIYGIYMLAGLAGGVDSVILRIKITESRLIELLTHRWCYKMAVRPFYQEPVSADNCGRRSTKMGVPAFCCLF